MLKRKYYKYLAWERAWTRAGAGARTGSGAWAWAMAGSVAGAGARAWARAGDTNKIS